MALPGLLPSREGSSPAVPEWRSQLSASSLPALTSSLLAAALGRGPPRLPAAAWIWICVESRCRCRRPGSQCGKTGRRIAAPFCNSKPVGDPFPSSPSPHAFCFLEQRWTPAAPSRPTKVSIGVEAFACSQTSLPAGESLFPEINFVGLKSAAGRQCGSVSCFRPTRRPTWTHPPL